MLYRMFLVICGLLPFSQGVASEDVSGWGQVAVDSSHFVNYLIVILVIFAILSLVLTVIMGLLSYKRPLVSGRELLVGQSDTVTIDEHGHCWLMLEGERWQCVADQPLVSGQRVKVTAVQRLKLKVVSQE